MKLAIWSDLHIGARQYRTDENNFNAYEWAGYKALKENVKIIKDEKPDLIINAGDTFETPNPSVLAMKNYFEAMNELKDISTMTILGNHDFSFANMFNKCSAVSMATHTYFADYELKKVELNDICFIMMPYIYGKTDVIADYLNSCRKMALESKCSKKILVTHGVTERYYRNSFISDPIMLSDGLVKLFDLVIIGHIHTPYDYIESNKTLVLSPGALIDYQAYEDRTGPIILDTDTMEWHKIKVKTPHIVKLNCTDKDINDHLKNVTEDIYKITFDGDVNVIDNDLFIKAKNTAVNLTIDVVKHDEEAKVETEEDLTIKLDIYDWVKENYSDYYEIFKHAQEDIMSV